MNVTRRVLVIGSAFVLAGSLAACGSDTPTAQTTPTPTTSAPATPSAVGTPSAGEATPGATGTAATCAALDQARLSLADVGDVNILQEGTNAFKAKVDVFEEDLDAVLEAAKSDFADEADAVRQARATLDSAAQQLGASPSVDGVAGVRTALSGLTTSFNQLVSAMDDAC